MKDEGESLVKPEMTLEGGTSDLLSSEVSKTVRIWKSKVLNSGHVWLLSD